MSPLRVFSLILFLVIGVSTFLDARKKGQNPLFPLLFLGLTFIYPLLIIALPLLFFLKKPKVILRNTPEAAALPDSKMCSKCGFENSPQDTECSQCRNTLAF